MSKITTMKDIAEVLDLSTSTASRVLSDRHEINVETKKRVLAYSDSVIFQQNPMAVSLKKEKSNSIGLIVCDVANYFFSQVIDDVDSITYDNGYHLIIY
jgi:LacI family transcriptional regulator